VQKPGRPSAPEAPLVGPEWRGNEDEWSALILACLLACPRHHPTAGSRRAPCDCERTLSDQRLLDRLLFVRRTNTPYLRELAEHREALAGRPGSHRPPRDGPDTAPDAAR
jgi:hypothetical protein